MSKESPVWEYTEGYKNRKRCQLATPYVAWTNAYDFAEEVAARFQDSRYAPLQNKELILHIWKDGKYRGEFLVEPETKVTWTAKKVEEER